MTDNKTQVYLSGIRNRDSQVIGKIYKDILPGITSWIRQNGGNEDDAKDIFQEMIISIYKNSQKPDFRITCTFWSYALIVCKNLWFAKNRNKSKMVYKESLEGEDVSIDKNIQNEIEQQEQLILYRKHFQKLGDSCQKILSLFFAKKKMTEIAEKLNMSAGYVKKQKFNCKEKLIKSIQADPIYSELSI